MRLFRSNKHLTPLESEKSHDIRVEVVVEKEANKHIANQAKEANRMLNELLEANHFTIKIYKAAGGTKRKGKA